MKRLINTNDRLSNGVKVALAFVVCLSATTTAWADPAVYNSTLPGTLLVVTDTGAIGSGVLVDGQKRLAITNHHVVEGASEVMVFFPVFVNGELVTDPSYYIQNAERLAIRTWVLRSEPRNDLAVIQLEHLPDGARMVPLATRSVQPGETVHSIGNSGVNGLGNGVAASLWRYSKGEVRQVYRKQSDQFDARVVETQVPSNRGDSGGPVVNRHGELVALTFGGNLEQTLVTYSVDISEIREMLASVTTSGSGAGVGPEVGGGVPVATKADPRVARALEQAGLIYRVEADGTYVVPFRYDDGSIQETYILSVTTYDGGREVRLVISVAAEASQPFPHELIDRLNRFNSGVGVWECVEMGPGQYVLAYGAFIDANAGAYELDQIVRHIDATCYEAATALPSQGGATFPVSGGGTPQPVGLWRALLSNGYAQMEVLIELRADGTFTMEMVHPGGHRESSSGRYTITANALILTHYAGAHETLQLSWVDANYFVLTLEMDGMTVQFHFRRIR